MFRSMVSPVLVGRDTELAALTAALDSAIAGEPAVILLGGEAGVGKTRLVGEAAERARDAGARVLVGSCVELGGEGLPFTPLADALRSLMRDTPPERLDEFVGPARPELARLLPELDPDRADGAAPTGGGGTDRLLELFLGVIARIAADAPLMLVVEDLHWGDRSTLDLVALLVRVLRSARVLVVVSFRSDELHRGHPMRPLLTGWERVRSVRRIELERFGVDEVAGQLEGILGTRPPLHLVELVYERSEGNAFLVEEILEAVQSGADPDELPVSLRDMLLARAERLSAPTQALLRVAAAGGRSVPDRLLAAVAGLDEPELDAAVREAVEHHILVVDEAGRGGYVFRHTLTRDAIYRDALPRERARIHAAYADALSADPGLAGSDATVAAALARHLSAAHDVPRALPACVEAARVAAPYAPAEALRHLERALEMWPSVPDAAERCGVDVIELLHRAGLAAYGAGALDRSIALLDEALGELGPAPDPERHALLLESRAQALLDLGRQDEATTALELAASLLPAEPPTVARAVVLASLALRRILNGDYELAAATAELAVAAAQAAGAREQEPNALITLGIARGYGGHSDGLALLRQGLELAEADGDLATAVRALLNEADQLDMLSRYEEAAESARRGLDLSRHAGLERGTLGVYLTTNLCESLLHLGRWDESERLLTDAADARPAGYLAGVLLQTRGLIRALAGRHDDAAEDIRAASRLNLGDVDFQFELPGEFARAELARVRGDLDVARDHVRIALDVAESMVRYRWPLVWLGQRLEAESADPDPERVAALGALADELPTRTPAARAYRELAAAEPARLSADWAAAEEACRELGDPYLLAYALLRRAQFACGQGDRDAAASPLREAVRLAATMGAAPLLDEARSLARRARIQVNDGEPETTVDGFGLTEREREVLELLADGRSNPQIAEALFISRKTASAHVSNIIGKLGVTSRGEAAAVAHRELL
jgi:DNA-binding CsgD family transcriptional regulator